MAIPSRVDKVFQEIQKEIPENLEKSELDSRVEKLYKEKIYDNNELSANDKIRLVNKVHKLTAPPEGLEAAEDVIILHFKDLDLEVPKSQLMESNWLRTILENDTTLTELDIKAYTSRQLLDYLDVLTMLNNLRNPVANTERYLYFADPNFPRKINTFLNDGKMGKLYIDNETLQEAGELAADFLLTDTEENYSTLDRIKLTDNILLNPKVKVSSALGMDYVQYDILPSIFQELKEDFENEKINEVLGEIVDVIDFTSRNVDKDISNLVEQFSERRSF